MTSPVGGEHISRYRAIAEFDNLIREADKAKRALRELREEQAKLNAESVEGDKKVAASKAQRARAESEATASSKKAVEDLSKNKATAEKAGEDTGASFTRGMGRKIEQDSKAGNNQAFLSAATNALKQAFANAGDDSGGRFVASTKARIDKDGASIGKSKGISDGVKGIRETLSRAGLESGNSFVQGFATKLRDLNSTLSVLGHDKLDLDVSTEDAKQSIAAIKFELEQLSHQTANPQVRIDSNRALTQLKSISKLFKDEVAEEIAKDSVRIQDELKKIDNLPSGKSFKFWALTALSDMTRVFEEAEKGVSVFEKLRRAGAASGSGGTGGGFVKTFIQGFDDLSESSSQLLQKLGRVSGELYRMPGIIAVLVSSVPALISGLGALGGGALGLVSALGSLSGLLAAGPGVIAAFAGATLSLQSAFGGLGDVLKKAKKAQAEEAEAKEKARLGTDKALTAAQKLKVAMEQLAPATEKSVGAIIKFSEGYAKLQGKVGEAFFKEVVRDIGKINEVLPIAENFLTRSARAMGKVADEGLKMITSGPWKRDFAIIAKNNASVIDNLGNSGLQLANVFRNIAVAAGPFTTWVTKALREGATAFADWSSQARSDGTILDFLDNTQQAAQSLWQILKNLGNVVNSFFQATVDEGQSYLRTLQDITGGWAEVAEAQEGANSPLREYMNNIRPVLSSLGALIRDVAKGLGGLASNQDNIGTMIQLLDSLRTKVLPPILSILQQLNDSGIAVTVVNALGELLEAIGKFLDSGAAGALSTFVTILADFATLLFDIASLPGVSDVLGAVASGLAAVAAVSIVARFTGLFKLWDFFTWLVRNKGNLANAFADAARGAVGLQTSGATSTRNVPSSIASYSGIGSEVLEQQAKATERVGAASQSASGKVSIFSRALNGIKSASGGASGALGGLTGFLGGPWGVALLAATTVIGVVTTKLSQNKQEAKDTKDAFVALKNAYGDIKEGNTETVASLSDTNEAFKKIIDQAQSYNLSLSDVSGALNNNGQSLNQFNGGIDAQINSLKASREAILDDIRARGVQTGEIGDGTEELNQQIEAAEKYKKSVNDVANATNNQNQYLQEAARYSRTYQQRLGGLTQAQVDSSVAARETGDQIKTLSNALDVMASASSTAEQRSNALSDIINHETSTIKNANEAAENFQNNLFSLSDAVKANGRSLDVSSRSGLRNRDALEAAATATRELYLQDIASGTPMEVATKAHEKRITRLKEEADKVFHNKKETEKLIQTYGDVPDSIKTDIKTDEKGFQAVYVELLRLQTIQDALKNGKSPAEAEKDYRNKTNSLYQRPPTTGNGPGFATGGPVYGEGTRTSDSIRAWLSNGEFVQPTDAVEHYGLPVMEALRKKKLNKTAIMEALPDEGNATFASGGHAHSTNCVACASGGHRLAQGGSITVPMVVNPRKTLIDKDWANVGSGELGGGSGSGGWQWQMRVLRQRFPGLPLISGYRPGSRTLSGNRSYHSVGRAVDLPPRLDVAEWIRSNYGSRTKELITPYNGLNIWNGRPHRYSGAIWNQHNFQGGNAHDHWAFNQGGLVDLMGMLGMNNMAPTRNAALPTTPRTLSPAASSVVNNTTENGTTFGDVIINNPVAERGGDSIRNALYRTQLLI